MSAITTNELLEAVAVRAASYEYRMWGFGEGEALVGLLQTGQILDRSDLIDRVADLVAPTISEAPQPTDHLISVEALYELKRVRPGINVQPLVDRFSHAISSAARPVPGRPQVHRPDLPALSTTIWVDCLHTDVPGMSLAGNIDLAVTVGEEASAVLQDASGLFSHGFDVSSGRVNGIHWGRGQGWALHGLAAAPAASVLNPRLERLVRALTQHEEDGAWRTIVDDPDSPRENSVSALVASGLLHAAKTRADVETGWLAMASRALSVAVDALDGDGGLPVSAATPVGDRTIYVDRQIGVFPWGQGPLLLALIEERTRHAS
jgi:unsaturated rhamnogalacturonyl hydrolase